MTGFSVRAGNVDMASTRVLISLSTSLRSASRDTSAVTVPTPSDAEDSSLTMPSTSWIASSTLMTTPSSTSCGAAPRYCTCTWTLFSSNSGCICLRIVDAESRPATMMRYMSRFAATWFEANQAMMPLRSVTPRGFTAARRLPSPQSFRRPAHRYHPRFGRACR